MHKLLNKMRFSVSGAAFLFGALMLLVLPLKWLAAAVLAAAWHEFCHWIAVKLCGGAIQEFSIGGNGAVMQADSMTPGREMICALAGPVGGLVLLLFARWLPRTAVCAAFHSLYNLLPILPLDGGRALRVAAYMLFPPRFAGRFCIFWEKAVKSLIAMAAIYGTFCLKLGILPLLLAAMILFKTKSEKLLAK